jgi:hypothetical protein
MTRTKWMRLGVRDPADILRWAGEQNARNLDEFRYRLIRGREFISFRMVPRYAIQIGTNDIIVVAHVYHTRRQRLAAAARLLYGRVTRRIRRMIGTFAPRSAEPAVGHTAELYQLPAPRRRSAPSRR